MLRDAVPFIKNQNNQMKRQTNIGYIQFALGTSSGIDTAYHSVVEPLGLSWRTLSCRRVSFLSVYEGKRGFTSQLPWFTVTQELVESGIPHELIEGRMEGIDIGTAMLGDGTSYWVVVRWDGCVLP